MFVRSVDIDLELFLDVSFLCPVTLGLYLGLYVAQGQGALMFESQDGPGGYLCLGAYVQL